MSSGSFFLLIIRMVEAMYKQSLEYFKQFRENFKKKILNNEPDVSDRPSNTNLSFAVHSNQNNFCSQSLVNGQPPYHVLMKVTKKCIETVNKMTLKPFIVPCLLFSFKYLIMGCSKYRLSGPLMEKIKVAVNNNSTNNFDTTGVSLRKQFPQICFASQTRSIQTQTDLITNVTIERFIRILNGDNAAQFSKVIDIILSRYVRLEINLNTLFVKFIMEKKFNFCIMFVKPEIIPAVCVLATIKHVFQKNHVEIIKELHKYHKVITSYA